MVDNGGENVVVDTAEVALAGNVEVTLLTPALAPGVLDDPVGGIGGSVKTPADKEDTVVEAGSAVLGDDSASVELPGGGISGNGEGANGLEGSTDLVDVAGDELVGGDLGGHLGSIIAAGTVGSSVRVVSLRLDTVLDGVLEGTRAQNEESK